MKLGNISEKLIPVFSDIITEISNLSYIAFIAMLCVSGVLFLFGNEHGAKETGKRAAYGFFIIQIANMLV